MPLTLTVINHICTDLGGVAGHKLSIDAINEICTLLGGTGGHKLTIDALNEICQIQGRAHVFKLNIDALNALIAGTVYKESYTAWSVIQQATLLNVSFTSSASFSAAENQTGVGTVVANAGSTYSIVAGGDGASFSINSSTGVLTFNSAPDYETKASYTVTVRATKSGINKDQTITVTVTNVSEATVFSSPTTTGITDIAATVGFTLDVKGQSTVYSIEYGATTAYGSTQAGGTATVNGAVTANLTLANYTIYHWRMKAVNADGTFYSNDQTLTTLYSFGIESTGTGVEVSTFRLQSSADITLTATGNVVFYDDAGGTVNAGTSRTITAGALRTFYLKCASGTGKIIVSDVSKLTRWGDSANDGWTSGANAAKITSEVNKLSITQLNITGTSILSGSLPTEVTYLFLFSNSINWTYSGALPTGVTTLYLAGNQINWTYSGALPTGLTYLLLSGSLINWTYSGALPTGLNFLYLSGSLINWTYSGALPTGVTTLYLAGNLINWTGLDIGNSGNQTTTTLAKYRTSKMTSADMITLLTQMKNRTGTLPATININDYADYASPPVGVTNAVTALKTAKSVTTVTLGA